MRDVLLQNIRENQFADGGEDGHPAHRNCGHAMSKIAAWHKHYCLAFWRLRTGSIPVRYRSIS
jgi:hypothetical protein